MGGMKNWKNFSLFGREILDNDSFKLLQEIIRTQNFGEPTVAFNGAVIHGQQKEKFTTAISDFEINYGEIADGVRAKSEDISPEDDRKVVELIKRCEILSAMAHTLDPGNEAFRRANIEKGKDYTGTRTASWKVLERNLGLEESKPERARISVTHLQNHSFG